MKKYGDEFSAFADCASSEVTFCGYSIPHPSESRMNIRVQSSGEGLVVDIRNVESLQELLLMVSSARDWMIFMLFASMC